MTSFDNEIVAKLIDAARLGDKSAYRLLLVEVERWSAGFYRQRVVSSAVNDLVQETLIAVHKKFHTYDSAQLFGPWLAAIARYKWVDYMRDVYRRAEIELTEDLVVEEGENFVSATMCLSSLLARLKPAQATVINLVKLQGYSIDEAAIATGQSPVSVRVNIHRGLKQLIAYAGQ